MNSQFDIDHALTRFESGLRSDAHALWPRVRRFLAAFVPAFIVAVLAAPGHLTLGTVLSIGGAVIVTVLGELNPSVPWMTIITRLDAARYGEPVSSGKGKT